MSEFPEDEGLDFDEPEQESAAEAKVRVAVQEKLLVLISAGQVEIPEAMIEEVAKDITMAALDAPSPSKMLKNLVKSLVHAEGVEEVYATDRELAESFAPVLQDFMA